MCSWMDSPCAISMVLDISTFPPLLLDYWYYKEKNTIQFKHKAQIWDQAFNLKIWDVFQATHSLNPRWMVNTLLPSDLDHTHNNDSDPLWGHMCLISIMEISKHIQAWGCFPVWYSHAFFHSTHAYVSSEVLCWSAGRLISNVLPENASDLVLLFLRGTISPERI